MKVNDAKILICDDSKLVREEISAIIKKAGTPEIIFAKDGDEALAVIEGNRPDIIFLDICMPNTDGFDVLKQALNYKPMPHIVIVSSLGTKSAIMEALVCGAKDFIQKPFKDEQIINALEKALKVL